MPRITSTNLIKGTGLKEVHSDDLCPVVFVTPAIFVIEIEDVFEDKITFSLAVSSNV